MNVDLSQPDNIVSTCVEGLIFRSVPLILNIALDECYWASVVLRCLQNIGFVLLLFRHCCKIVASSTSSSRRGSQCMCTSSEFEYKCQVELLWTGAVGTVFTSLFPYKNINFPLSSTHTFTSLSILHPCHLPHNSPCLRKAELQCTITMEIDKYKKESSMCCWRWYNGLSCFWLFPPFTFPLFALLLFCLTPLMNNGLLLHRH